mgnify:CR=1 FL=1
MAGLAWSSSGKKDSLKLRIKQEHAPSVNLSLRNIKDVHRTLYREVVEWFGLPSRVAVDYYRDALANAKA